MKSSTVAPQGISSGIAGDPVEGDPGQRGAAVAARLWTSIQSHLAVPDGQTKSKESVRDSELSGTAGYDLVKNNLQLREFHPG